MIVPKPHIKNEWKFPVTELNWTEREILKQLAI